MTSSLTAFLENKQDVGSGLTPTEKAMKELADANPETGWQRLKRVITPDEFGKLSPEVNSVLQVGCMSMFVGALYGGVMSSRTAYMDFFRSNQATAFKDHLEAKKRLQDKVTLSFGRGAFRWGWRLTLFCTTYVGASTAISTYRGKNGIIEHLIAGAITGIAYKFNMGPRGWVVGGGLGCALGLISGGMTLGMLKLSGLSMEQVRDYNGRWDKMRTEAYTKSIREHLQKEEHMYMTKHSEDHSENKSLDVIK